jgi:methylenetetrahydrofolate dehydrogenase (NADP+)/methenyltetrahydrofolate cyclohydrolase
MTAQIIDGEAIGAEIRAEVARRVDALKAKGVTPGLAAILVGEDPGSVQYVGMKRADCAEAGIVSETFQLPAKASEDEVLALMASLNADDRFHAILPQLPMPPQVDSNRVLDAMKREKDADGLHPANLGKLLRGDLDGAIPCTPNGVMELLRRSGNNTAG